MDASEAVDELGFDELYLSNDPWGISVPELPSASYSSVLPQSGRLSCNRAHPLRRLLQSTTKGRGNANDGPKRIRRSTFHHPGRDSHRDSRRRSVLAAGNLDVLRHRIVRIAPPSTAFGNGSLSSPQVVLSYKFNRSESFFRIRLILCLRFAVLDDLRAYLLERNDFLIRDDVRPVAESIQVRPILKSLSID